MMDQRETRILLPSLPRMRAPRRRMIISELCKRKKERKQCQPFRVNFTRRSHNSRYGGKENRVRRELSTCTGIHPRVGERIYADAIRKNAIAKSLRRHDDIVKISCTIYLYREIHGSRLISDWGCRDRGGGIAKITRR